MQYDFGLQSVDVVVTRLTLLLNLSDRTINELAFDNNNKIISRTRRVGNSSLRDIGTPF